MPPKGRKNRFKIRCLECNPNVEVDFDHRNKHNSRFHNDLLKTRKHVRFEMVGAPKNPFEAAARKKSNNTAESAAGALVTRWISAFGVPSTITTDRGAQFESSLLSHLTMSLAFKRIRTTAYHPCSNGILERFHRQLKASLKANHDSNK